MAVSLVARCGGLAHRAHADVPQDGKLIRRDTMRAMSYQYAMATTGASEMDGWCPSAELRPRIQARTSSSVRSIMRRPARNDHVAGPDRRWAEAPSTSR